MLSTSESRKLKSTKRPKEKSKPPFTFVDVAKHAAKKGQRRDLRNQNNEYRIAKLFRENKNNYKIEKLREYNYSKFSTTRSDDDRLTAFDPGQPG